MESGRGGYLDDVGDIREDRRYDPSAPATRPARKLGGAEFARRGMAVATTSTIVGRKGFDREEEVLVPTREGKFLVRIAGVELAESRGVVLALHGAGFTGMSWAPSAAALKGHCCVLAPDLRGHGQSTSADDAAVSLEDLTEDIACLLVEVIESGLLAAPPTPPSSGAAGSDRGRGQGIGVPAPGEAAAGAIGGKKETRNDPGGPACVVEVEGVRRRGEEEGGATTAFGEHKEHGERARAGVGASEEAASVGESAERGEQAEPRFRVLLVGHSLGGSIAVRLAEGAGELRRRCGGRAEIGGVVAIDVVEGTALAALENMPQVLKKIPESFATMEEAVTWHLATGAVRRASSAPVVVPSRLKDDGSGERFVWRTDLRATERHWRGWFEGLSEAFLALPLPKLLMVAGMDRLDTMLTGAHMQGRFQLKLVYGCGHSIQEDRPEETAGAIISFGLRHSVIRQGKTGTVGGGAEGLLSEEEKLERKLARARRA